jgi:uncharacterized membrane protein
MTNQVPGDVTSDDKLWAALAYVFTPLVPIIVLLIADKKDRPFIKAHNMQALIWGIALYVIGAVTSPILGLGCLIWLVGFLIQLYWAYQAYQGKMVSIPVVSDFVKNQGWA